MDQQRDDLARLVRHHRTRLRLSYQDLSDRLADHGDPHVSRSWLHRLEHGQLPNPPKRPRLEAIAAALGLDTEELVEASVAEFYGYLTIWSTDHTARDLVRASDWEAWPESERAKIRRILDRKPDTDSM
jgi:transcriptional regulator with XRE-family HTH domain